MLIGSYTASLTKNRRVAVPVQFRRELGKKLILARWYENCLVLISTESWSKLLKRVTGKSGFATEPVRNTDRFILGSAFELEADAQGRILIPGRLSQYAGLKKEAIFVGLGDRIEVWEKSIWDKQEEFIASNASQMMERIANENKTQPSSG